MGAPLAGQWWVSGAEVQGGRTLPYYTLFVPIYVLCYCVCIIALKFLFYSFARVRDLIGK